MRLYLESTPPLVASIEGLKGRFVAKGPMNNYDVSMLNMCSYGLKSQFADVDIDFIALKLYYTGLYEAGEGEWGEGCSEHVFCFCDN